jgi:hypothetical protein
MAAHLAATHRNLSRSLSDRSNWMSDKEKFLTAIFAKSAQKRADAIGAGTPMTTI